MALTTIRVFISVFYVIWPGSCLKWQDSFHDRISIPGKQGRGGTDGFQWRRNQSSSCWSLLWDPAFEAFDYTLIPRVGPEQMLANTQLCKKDVVCEQCWFDLSLWAHEETWGKKYFPSSTSSYLTEVLSSVSREIMSSGQSASPKRHPPECSEPHLIHDGILTEQIVSSCE